MTVLLSPIPDDKIGVTLNISWEEARHFNDGVLIGCYPTLPYIKNGEDKYKAVNHFRYYVIGFMVVALNVVATGDEVV